MMTTEKVDPNWDHKIVKRFKGLIQADEGAPIYKTYYHVLTEPQKYNFKLVDQIWMLYHQWIAQISIMVSSDKNQLTLKNITGK